MSEHLPDFSNAMEIFTKPLYNEKNIWYEFVCVEKTDPHAIVPTENTIGYDLYSFDSFSLEPLEKRTCNLRIKINMPPGFYGRVWSVGERFTASGLIFGSASGGEVVVVVTAPKQGCAVVAGEKIALLTLEQAAVVPVKEVKSLRDLFVRRT